MIEMVIQMDTLWVSNRLLQNWMHTEKESESKSEGSELLSKSQELFFKV